MTSSTNQLFHYLSALQSVPSTTLAYTRHLHFFISPFLHFFSFSTVSISSDNKNFIPKAFFLPNKGKMAMSGFFLQSLSHHARHRYLLL